MGESVLQFIVEDGEHYHGQELLGPELAQCVAHQEVIPGQIADVVVIEQREKPSLVGLYKRWATSL